MARGFYYSRFPEGAVDEGAGNTEISQEVYFHKLGTAQAEDALIYRDPTLECVQYTARVSADGRFLLLSIDWEARIANRLYYRPIESGGDFLRLFDELDAEYRYVGNDGDVFYVLTTNDALNWRVIAVDINNPAPENWVDAVPEHEEAIAGVAIVNGQFVVTAMRDARHVVKIYNKDGSFERELDDARDGLGGHARACRRPWRRRR